MGLYSDLEDVFDYLISVRKLKMYLSFDIELPKTWKIPKRYANEEKVVEIQSKTDNKRSFSFVSEFNQSDVDLTVNNIKNIISYNKEIEQKERLLQSKIQELKQIFEKTNLDNLQSLKFEIIEQSLTNGEEVFDADRKRSGVVEE
jgi:hypothetical protein